MNQLTVNNTITICTTILNALPVYGMGNWIDGVWDRVNILLAQSEFSEMGHDEFIKYVEILKVSGLVDNGNKVLNDGDCQLFITKDGNIVREKIIQVLHKCEETLL